MIVARDPRAVLRVPAPRRPVGPAAVVDDELAPLLLGLAVGGRGHDGAGLARVRHRRDHRNGALRRHGDAAAGPAPRLHPARRVGRLALHAPARLAPGARRRRHLLPRAPAALRRARHGPLGRPRRLRRLPVHRPCAWPRRPRVAPFDGRSAGPRWRSRPAGPDRHPGRADRRRRRASRPPSSRSSIVMALAWAVGLAPRRGRVTRAGGSSWSAGEAVVVALVLAAPWVIGTALAGKGAVAIFGLPVRGADGPELGRGHPLRHRPGGPLAHRVAPGGGRRASAAARTGGQADLGGAPVGHGLRVVGPRLRGDARRPGSLHALGVGGPGAGRPRRGRLRRPRHLRLRERPDRPGVRVATGGRASWRWSSWRSACSRWPSARPTVAGTFRRRGVEQPLAFLAHPEHAGVGPGAVARRPEGPPRRGLVGAARPGLRADAAGPAGRGAGVHPRRPGAGRAGGRRRPPGRLRRDGAPRPAARSGRRALRGGGRRPGPVHGGHRAAVGQRARAGRAQHGPPGAGRPAGRPGRGRRAGLRERRGHARRRPSAPTPLPVVRDVVVPERRPTSRAGSPC